MSWAMKCAFWDMQLYNTCSCLCSCYLSCHVYFHRVKSIMQQVPPVSIILMYSLGVFYNVSNATRHSEQSTMSICHYFRCHPRQLVFRKFYHYHNLIYRPSFLLVYQVPRQSDVQPAQLARWQRSCVQTTRSLVQFQPVEKYSCSRNVWVFTFLVSVSFYSDRIYAVEQLSQFVAFIL